VPHPDPDDPPRRRANKRRGHGTFANDRPPVAGVFGRGSGLAHLEVLANSDGANLVRVVEANTAGGCVVNTDEWGGYARVADTGRRNPTVNHSPGVREWARDDDGDGVREAHVNTAEGVWAGLRNFLRPFRGVSKWHLAQYVAVFQWAHNLKAATDDFLHRWLCGKPITDIPT
jgi:transposase